MRLIIAAALTVCAVCCYQRSVALIDKASSVPRAAEEIEGNLDFFDQPNPLKAKPSQEQILAVRNAQWMQRFTVLSGGAALVAFLAALARRRPNQENQPCDSVAPSSSPGSSASPPSASPSCSDTPRS
ncbi:hypothetical protein [Tautonia marina]|uniref:hypothetical protein n=1 Tax=Tautonia marina TaxID=2653855 RepID=UPI0013759EF1|nr:hypothetical protein [Tautonia marina]